MEHEELTHRIIGCAMQVHGALGPGFLESVYQNALAHELRRSALAVECGRSIEVRYRGVVVGNFVADMLVGRHVMVENKAVRALGPVHEVQLVNYLTATRTEIGLLLNFGADRLEFRRKTRAHRPRVGGRDGRDERHGPRELHGQDEQDEQDGRDGQDEVHPVHPVHPV